MKKRILIIHGANVNMIGEQETGIYGKESFESINSQIVDFGKKIGVMCDTFHSNVEGNIINKIQRARDDYDGIVINAGAYSHYSLAIRDAIGMSKIPTVEVHLSNIYRREDFRHQSVLAGVCVGQIVGFGKRSYMLAIEALLDII